MLPIRTAQFLGFVLAAVPTAVGANDFYSSVFNGAAAMGGGLMSNAPMPAPVPLYPGTTMAPAPMPMQQQQPYRDPFHSNQQVNTGSSYSSSSSTINTITPQQLQYLKQNQVQMQPPVQRVQPQVQYRPQVMSAPVTGFNAPPRPVPPRKR